MRVEPLVCLGDELLIKSLLASARLVTGNEENGFALWIEGKSDAPNTARCNETKLLHVGVPGPAERINTWTPQLWPEPL